MKNSKRVVNLLYGVILAFISYNLFSLAINPHILLGLVIVGLLVALFAPVTGVAMITTFYSPSNLALGQAKLIEKFASSAKKEIDPATFRAFVRNATISNPDFASLRTREDRSLAGYFLMRTKRALGSGRSYNATGATGTSNTLVPAYSTFTDEYSTSLKLMDNNVFSTPEMVANELENIFKNFSSGNESSATSALVNNRSSVNIAVAEGQFNGTTNVFQINDTAVGNRAWQISGSMMAENYWGDMPMTYFCDAISFNKARFYAAQGATNATNTSFQFGNDTFIRSLDLTATAISLGYTKGFWLVVPDGTYAVLDWIPKQNRDGVDLPPYRYFNAINPYDGLTYAGYEWYVGIDNFTNSVAQDIQMNSQFSIDLAYEFAPLTTAGETPVQAVALV